MTAAHPDHDAEPGRKAGGNGGPPVELKGRRLACRNSRFSVFFDHVAEPGRGEVEDYLVVVPHSVREADLLAGVAVLPVCDGRIVLLRSYRHPVGASVLELARGFIDAGETPAEAALRELREETGLACPPDRLVPLGFCAPEAGVLRGRVALFAAMACQPAGGERDRHELGLGEPVRFSLDEARALQRDMSLEDVTTVIALHRALMILDAAPPAPSPQPI